MDEIQIINKRRYSRIVKPLPVKFTYLSGYGWKTCSGICQNISQGGLFLGTDVFNNGNYSNKDQINLSIYLTDWNDKIDALTEIVWGKYGDDDQDLGVGLRFTYLSPLDKARLVNYISSTTGYYTAEKAPKSIPIEIKVSTVVKQHLDVVFKLLREIEKFPMFMKDLRNIEILYKEGNKIITKWMLAVEEITLEWTQESMFCLDDASIQFKMLSGDFKSFYGEWKFTKLLTGTQIDLIVTIEWGIPVLERHLGSRLTELAKQILQDMLRAIKKKLWVPKVAKLLKFAATIHPLDVSLFSTYEIGAKDKREIVVNKLLEWTPPFKYAPVTGIKSNIGKCIDGELILCPLLPEQILTLNSHFVLNRIIEAGHIAEKLGAKIFALGGYTAQVGQKGVKVANALKIPVTTGTTYTIVTVIEAVLKTARDIGIDIAKTKMLIIGATGSIGSICAKVFSEMTSELYLLAQNQTRLNNLASSLVKEARSRVNVITDINSALINSDIVLTATNTPKELFNINMVAPGTLICDISLPKNITKASADLRKDVLVIDGGVVRPPGNPNFNLYYGLPLDLTYACIAEAIILTLEERFESYSIGGNVSLEKVKEMTYLASKHGFQLAELRSFGELITPEQIQMVRHCYNTRGQKQ